MSYLRVSTAKQRRAARPRSAACCGHGLAQWRPLEVGRRGCRNRERQIRQEPPGLRQALDACRRYGAKLIISRLDRLSRDPVFLLSLRDAGIDFIAVDMPGANRMTIGIMALVAEQEREAIRRAPRLRWRLQKPAA